MVEEAREETAVVHYASLSKETIAAASDIGPALPFLLDALAKERLPPEVAMAELPTAKQVLEEAEKAQAQVDVEMREMIEQVTEITRRGELRTQTLQRSCLRPLLWRQRYCHGPRPH